ncbi:FMN-dependent NADH-azoreductase [Paracoccus tegillarcae]|uniref:FMN dependent NADH:quinone oxidoreductase n=1 Tax=Paracoccus tegillarcae TaxID=1529068 RepID=A0A2K9EWS0_9RHOB|nr:NAD(P)H-dependent oxidoreductase [Paracoccus tegillarcae]AUH32502.1 FMN-dependent NADH-azoreductase [Paracoccus tegillarcae]
MNILRIDSTIKPREASVSAGLADRVLARLTAADPKAVVTTRDVIGVPAIDGNWLGAVFTPADQRNADQVAIAAYADELLNEVRAADTLVIALPVYNFAIPAQLKNWLDQLARKGETFRYTEAGPEGLLKGKRAIVALSSDGTQLGSDIDFASGYLRHMLGFFGITDVEFVAADRMAFGADETLARAHEAVDQLAA